MAQWLATPMLQRTGPTSYTGSYGAEGTTWNWNFKAAAPPP